MIILRGHTLVVSDLYFVPTQSLPTKAYESITFSWRFL